MPDPLPPAPQTASILLVDDHPANVVALEAILAPLGHELVTASSGEEALLQLQQRDFAIILLEVQMAGLRHAAQQLSDAFGAHAGRSTRRSGRDAGAARQGRDDRDR